MECVNVVATLMKISGKRSFVWKARKSDNYKYDEDDKQKVIDIIRKFFNIYCVRCELIDVGTYGRIPDLRTTNHNPILYIELDGAYHGFGDEISTTKKTSRRNLEYEEKGLGLIVINKELTDGYEEKKVVEMLKPFIKSNI